LAIECGAARVSIYGSFDAVQNNYDKLVISIESAASLIA